MRVMGRISTILACLLLLAACGSDDVSTDSSTPIAATPPSTPASPDMEVGQIIWAQAINPETGEPTDIVTRFTTQSPSINAVIEASNVPEGTEFDATWTINDEPIIATEQDIIASDDLDHAWIAFSFTRDPDQRYPIGQLNVVITTSEGDVREGSVEIGFP